MGHDISAYLGPDDPRLRTEWLAAELEGPEIAYLHRTDSDPLRHQLYEVLDAQDCDGNASGAPATRWFSREHLESGLARLRERLASGLEVDREIRFVESCLRALPPGRDSVYVYFS